MSEAENQSTPDSSGIPSNSSVRQYLMYSLSVPERALRSGVGVVGGAVRETASLLVPQAFQSSKTYSVMVQQMLDFVVEDIGGVERKEGEEESTQVENFVARKTVGNFVEMAGLATMHVSPLTILAVLSDVAYGSNAFLKEWGDELKRQGIIDENSTINRVDDLLSSVAAASATIVTARSCATACRWCRACPSRAWPPWSASCIRAAACRGCWALCSLPRCSA